MVIIKKDKKCPECGYEFKKQFKSLTCGRKYSRCPKCGHVVMTGKVLYDDIEPEDRKQFDKGHTSGLITTIIVFAFSILVILALQDESVEGVFKVIMFISGVLFIIKGIHFLMEKSQTLKAYDNGLDEKLFRLEKNLSKRIEKEGFKKIYKFSDGNYYYNCEHCDWYIKVGDKKCSHCGEKVTPIKVDFDDEDEIEEPKVIESEEEYFTCDNCGAKVNEDANKCPKCGAIFDEEIEEDDEDDDDEYTCDNCGAVVKEDSKKCPKCGAIFDEEIEEDDEDDFDDDDDDDDYDDDDDDDFDDAEDDDDYDDDDDDDFDDAEDDDDYDDDDFDDFEEDVDEEDEEPETIEPETIESETSIDDKYESLLKLKDLLDKKIITKEEFEIEKKKILK